MGIEHPSDQPEQAPVRDPLSQPGGQPLGADEIESRRSSSARPLVSAVSRRWLARALVRVCDDARQAVLRRQISEALIARCTGTSDVIAAVGFARSEGLTVAVRGGSHNVAGSATCDGGLVIDLSPMKGVRVDAARRRDESGTSRDDGLR